jgi:hypothetical protein
VTVLFHVPDVLPIKNLKGILDLLKPLYRIGGALKVNDPVHEGDDGAHDD